MSDMIDVRMPIKFKPLFTPSRYKGVHGGRGSAKSWSIVDALLIKAAQKPLRILCCREIQNSIKQSVKRLIDDRIKALGLENFYSSLDTEIRGLNGSLFVFAGLRSNPDSIKSMEGIDIAWVEEAQRVSQNSIDILTPTIRKEGSEIWFSWNPEEQSDPVDQLFRGKNGAPPDSIIIEANFEDNPFFPEVLRKDLEWDQKRDPDKYAHVWKGKYRKNSEARVFRNWIVEEFETPADALFRFGADWGFSVDPNVLIRQWVDVKQKKLYIDYEAYEVGCEIDETPALFAGNCPYDKKDVRYWENKKNRPGIPGALKWNIRADSARPETISYMRKRGFKIVGATKGPGSIEDGITFLKSYDIVIHPRCKHTIDEMTFFSFKIDPHTGEVLPVLMDKKNHVIDSCRYGLEELRKAMETAPVVVPAGDTQSSSATIG